VSEVFLKFAIRNPQSEISMAPLIAIVGRPNVGKSTLFNRLVGRRRSIVTDEPGITRDRIYGTATWDGHSFEVVDTGGMIPGDPAELPQRIFEQAQIAMEQASLILFVLDGRAAVTGADQELANLLRKTDKPVFLVVNKIDSAKQAADVAEFHRLGFQHVFPVSAEHGRGITELLDDAAISLPPVEQPPDEPPKEIRVALIGRPNVGKSTLLNKLIGEERALVSSAAGTTRDAVDSVVQHNGVTIRFIDTAGIRRKGRTELKAEKLSVVMARRHLEQSDVAVLLIDGHAGVTALDAHIAGYAHEAARSVILAVNKWDIVQKSPSITSDFEAEIREKLKFISFAPVLFVSAKTGQRIHKLYGLIEEVYGSRFLRVSTRELNDFLRQEVLVRGGLPSEVKIRYIAQVRVDPPTFVLFSNKKYKLHFSFERFIENRIRERFPFTGTPIIIKQRVRARQTRRAAEVR
jgi:GTP-binding protein